MLVIKKNISDFIVVRFNGFTEFSLKSDAFINAVNLKFGDLSSDNVDSFAQSVVDNLKIEAKESGSYSFVVIEAKNGFKLTSYDHVFPHGKDANPHVCSKSIVLGHSCDLDKKDLLNAAMFMMGESHVHSDNENFSTRVGKDFFDYDQESLEDLKASGKEKIKSLSSELGKEVMFCVVC